MPGERWRLFSSGFCRGVSLDRSQRRKKRETHKNLLPDGRRGHLSHHQVELADGAHDGVVLGVPGQVARLVCADSFVCKGVELADGSFGRRVELQNAPLVMGELVWAE